MMNNNNILRYNDMSLEELRMLGDKALNDIANEIMNIFNSMAQVYDESLIDWLEQLEELYTRLDYVTIYFTLKCFSIRVYFLIRSRQVWNNMMEVK